MHSSARLCQQLAYTHFRRTHASLRNPLIHTVTALYSPQTQPFSTEPATQPQTTTQPPTNDPHENPRSATTDTLTSLSTDKSIPHNEKNNSNEFLPTNKNESLSTHSHNSESVPHNNESTEMNNKPLQMNHESLPIHNESVEMNNKPLPLNMQSVPLPHESPQNHNEPFPLPNASPPNHPDPPPPDPTPLEPDELPLHALTPDERRFYYARTWPAATCALCAEPVHDWLSHMQLPTHRARQMVCAHLVSADRYALMLANLWHFLHFDAALIREFDVKKDSRRRRRLHDTLGFLVQHNVLLYAVYRWCGRKGVWVRPVDFGKCLLAGEAVVRGAVVDRVARLFPGATAGEMAALCEVIMDIPAMAALYDVLQLNAFLPAPQRRQHKLTGQMKRASVLAMCGEMNWFVAKSRATDRAFNNTLFPPSDTLVVHVLCHHAVETMLMEVVHFYVHKILRETLPVWNHYKGKLPYVAGKIAWYVRPRKVYPQVLKNTDLTTKEANEIVIKPRPVVTEQINRLAPILKVLPRAIPSWKVFAKEDVQAYRRRPVVSNRLQMIRTKSRSGIQIEPPSAVRLPPLRLPTISEEPEIGSQ